MSGIVFGNKLYLEKKKGSSPAISLTESLANQIDAGLSFTNQMGACVMMLYPEN